jgi:hypothetical protein
MATWQMRLATRVPNLHSGAARNAMGLLPHPRNPKRYALCPDKGCAALAV